MLRLLFAIGFVCMGCFMIGCGDFSTNHIIIGSDSADTFADTRVPDDATLPVEPSIPADDAVLGDDTIGNSIEEFYDAFFAIMAMEGGTDIIGVLLGNDSPNEKLKSMMILPDTFIWRQVAIAYFDYESLFIYLKNVILRLHAPHIPRDNRFDDWDVLGDFTKLTDLPNRNEVEELMLAFARIPSVHGGKEVIDLMMSKGSIDNKINVFVNYMDRSEARSQLAHYYVNNKGSFDALLSIINGEYDTVTETHKPIREDASVQGTVVHVDDISKYDVTGDGTVDNVDAGLVSDAKGTNTAKYDVNGDGTVNFLDLLLVFDNRDPKNI